MACIVMAYLAMVYIVLAYIVMARARRRGTRSTSAFAPGGGGSCSGASKCPPDGNEACGADPQTSPLPLVGSFKGEEECPTGYGLLADMTCEVCREGTSGLGKSSQCVECSPGLYTDRNESEACSNCPQVAMAGMDAY